MGIASLIQTVLQFYGTIIIVYVLMSWFPMRGILEDIHNALATIVEPYLGIFRRFIPPIGAIDISPMVAYLVLVLIGNLLTGGARLG